jgi:RNA polymerase sigma-70 factor (ECF subfamily)
VSERDDNTDARLMAGLARGDRSALGALVDRHQRRILEFAYRCTGEWNLAEDLAQETFLRLWSSAERYEPKAGFITWVYRIVINLCLDSKKKKAPKAVDSLEAVDEAMPTPEEALDAKERAERVRKALDRLPDRQRLAVVLHRFEGLPVRGIAEITGDSESAVESLLVRAYAELRTSLAALKKK